MVIVQAALGLRVGELLALRVQDVDFLRRVVHVEHQVNRRTYELVDPKTATSKRTIPLPRVAADVVAAHLARWPASAPVRCRCTVVEHASAPTSGLIFHTRTGTPRTHNHHGTRVLGRGVVRAGERAREACEACDGEGWVLEGSRWAAPAQRCQHAGDLPTSTTTHDLRHHYASVLLAARESVVDVAERLGHAEATLVLTTYGHLTPNSEDRTRTAIDAAWSASGGVERSDAAPAR
jgi:integrase